MSLDHIQLPKLILRQFSHKTIEGQKAHYLDFETGIVDEKKINFLGAIENYYNKNTETYLNQEVENKVGEIFKSFNQIAKNGPINCFKIEPEDEENIKEFFRHSLKRSKSYNTTAKAQLIHTQFVLDEKSQDEALIKIPIDFFDPYFANILINKSSVHFVVPHTCLYSIDSYSGESGCFWVLPISPLCCVFLTSNKYKDKYFENGCLSICVIKEDELVLDFNTKALHSENTFSRKFIVGDDINELNRLGKILQSIKKQS